jgi:hypothetical protein
MNRPCRSSAFTLIELMLSIALGSLIIYTAVAGFNAAAHAVTIANRLSLENSLLRAGYFQVEEDLDFWTSLDDPLDSSPSHQHQQLRGTLAGGKVAMQETLAGNPFTPMSDLMKANLGTITPAVRFPPSTIRATDRLTYGEIKPRPSPYASGSATTTDSWETDQGFDPTIAYSPSDPRTWVRTNMAEKDFGGGTIYQTGYGTGPYWNSNIFPWGFYIPAAIFGRYGMFSNTSPTPSFNNWQIGVTTPFNNKAYVVGATPPYMVTYSGNAHHNWYPNQIKLLLSALGYEAMFEYLPPNAIYEYYMSYSASQFTYGGAASNYAWIPHGGDASNQWSWGVPMDSNGLSRICTQPGWGYGGGFRNGDGNQLTACGMYRESYSTSMGYFNPWAAADPNGEPGSFYRHYMHFDSDYTAYTATTGSVKTNYGSSGLQDLLAHTANPQLLLAQSPLHWPAVQCCVGRLVKNNHHVAVAKIIRIDPLTGMITELSFLGLGTSLRGARMQRKDPTYGTGWAHWDDDPAVMSNSPGSNRTDGNEPNLDSPTATTQP